MATTATRKTYPVAYELFDTPAKIPAIIDMLLGEGFRIGVSAQVIDDENDYQITATKVMGDDPEDPQAPVNRVTVTIGDVVVNDNGFMTRQEAETFLESYDPPAAQKDKLKAVRDEKVAIRAAKKKAAEDKVAEEEAAAAAAAEVAEFDGRNPGEPGVISPEPEPVAVPAVEPTVEPV